MSKRTVLFNMLPWNGGLDTSVDEGMIPQNRLIQADNVVFSTSGARKKREGIDELAPLTTAAGDVIGMADYWHEITSGKQQRIIVVKNDGATITPILVEADGTESSPTVVGSPSWTASDATTCHIETMNNAAVLAFDGSTTPKKLSYATTGVSEVTSIVCVADVADSLDGKYFIIYDDVGSVGVWIDVDDSGTTIPAGAAAADRAIEITTIVTGDNAATVATAVQTALDADSKFSATVNSATVTVTASAAGYRTDAADGDTGFTISVTTQGITSGTYYIRDLPGSPPNFSICRKHLGRLWTNDKNLPDYIHYSPPGDIETWQGAGDSGGINDLGVGDGDPKGLTAIMPSFKGQLYVGKRKSLYRITGFSPLTFKVEPVSVNLGCASHGSCVGIEQDDVVFASDRGFHSIQATDRFGDVENTFLSAAIQPTFNTEIEADRRAQIKGVYIPTLNSVAWAVTQEGKTKNNAIYLYNTSIGEWYRWPMINAESMAIAFLSNKDKLIIGESGGSVGLGRLLEAQQQDQYKDFNSQAIPLTIKTGIIFPDNQLYSVKGFKKLGLIFRNRGSTQLTVSFKVDDFDAQPKTFSIEGSLALLGESFVLGASKLAGTTVVAPLVLPVDGYGRGFQITITNEQADEPTEIYGFTVEFQPAGDAQETAVNREAS